MLDERRDKPGDGDGGAPVVGDAVTNNSNGNKRKIKATIPRPCVYDNGSMEFLDFGFSAQDVGHLGTYNYATMLMMN